MKLFYIFLGVALIALAGTSFYYTNVKKEETRFVVATSTKEVATIYIYREYGDVTFKNKSANTFTPVTDTKVTIANYATVKTGDGRGYVIFPDNSSITLSTSTEIEISYEPTKVSIMQLIGSTYHRVTTLATGNKYEVRTPNTLAAVRGTKLAVTYNPKLKKTFVAVTENRVEVTSTKEDGTPNNAPVLVQEGSLADIQSSTSTPKGDTPQFATKMIIRTNEDIKEIKMLLEENKIIDKEYDKAPVEMRKEFLERIINLLQKEKLIIDKNVVEESAPSEVKKETRSEVINRIIKDTKITPQGDTSAKTPAPTTPTRNPVTKVNTDTPTTAKTNTSSPIPTQERRLKELPTNIEEFSPEQESFIDSFYITYERYFLVDGAESYCKRIGSITAKEMMVTLLAITNKEGYILPNQAELASFANDLVTSCQDGSMQNKSSSFKTKFDSAYPY